MSHEHQPGQNLGGPAGPPPGWYPDPDGLPVLRWWDGVRWGPLTEPHQPYGQPQQQPYVPESQPQALRTPRRPGHRKARYALIGLGTLIGIIIVITVATGHSPSSSGQAAASSPPTCSSQLAAWRNSGVSEIQAVATDMYNLGSADQALYQALIAGKAASAHEAKLQTTAASVQGDAQTAEANLPPSCIPDFRSDLRTGINDADKAGIDSGRAVSEVTSGNYSVATEDVRAADKAENAGTAEIQAAAADLKAYENG